MLDAQTQLKGPGLDDEALGRERAEGVPCTMADREHHGVAGNFTLRCANGHDSTIRCAGQRLETRVEMESHAHRFERRP